MDWVLFTWAEPARASDCGKLCLRPSVLLNGRNLWELVLTHGLLDSFSLYALYVGLMGAA
ncbi:MAG: hypothetical protein V3T39_00735 [Gammaproteobacteria bacterium]